MMNTSPRQILVIEDDPSIVLGLRMNLMHEGHQVSVAEDGPTGLEAARRGYDLLILDINLPGLNGFEVLRTLRNEGIDTPVIVLSARSAELDKIVGLDLGADDYVSKPFSLGELMARVRATLRRIAEVPSRVWNFGDIQVIPATREVRRHGETVSITATEFDLLMLLVQASGRVLTRRHIFDTVWGSEHHGTLRTIDNFIAQLRSKLEQDPANPQHLLTVRGVGYRLIP